MKRILFTLAQLCLLITVSANIVRAQNHVQTITVTNGTTTITADGNYNQILLRENAATPSAAFSITLAGSSTAINYPAGTQFLFSGNFTNGQAIGTIQATTAGPFTFIAVEASGPPSMSVKNTILSGGGSMVYPGAGVPLSTGSSWGTSYTVGTAANNLVQLNGNAQILSSMIPNPSATTLGGIESLSVVAHNFLTGISTSGVPTQAQPGFSDISGTLINSQLPTSGVTAGSYTISSITVNAQGIVTSASSGSGSSFTVQTNGTNNSSSSALNFLTSTANSDGLTITPSNPSSTGEKLEITGNYTGPYSSLSGLPQLAVTISAVSHNFLTSYTSSTGLFTQAQPALSDLTATFSSPLSLSTNTLSCPTCVTSAASLTSNAVVIGGGSQASSTISADTTTTHALFATAGAPAFRAIVAGDIPTLNQNTTGSAGSLSATLAIASGGTNATSAANALINLFPTASEVGDIVYCSAFSASACTSWSILAGNTSGTKVLQETSAGAPSWVAAGAGTVTGCSFTGGLISCSGSTTTASTVAGTSGGVVYFSGTSTWASSALLTANMPMIGGGAGTAPSVGTVSGNTTEFVTTTGTQTSGNVVTIDANGNHIASGSTVNTFWNINTGAAVALTASSTKYLTAGGLTATVGLGALNIPYGAKIIGMYVNYTTAVNGASTSQTWTLLSCTPVQGTAGCASPTASNITCPVGNSQTQCNDTSHSLTSNPGDLYFIQEVANGGTATTTGITVTLLYQI